jgi:hypothetical protein
MDPHQHNEPIPPRCYTSTQKSHPRIAMTVRRRRLGDPPVRKVADVRADRPRPAGHAEPRDLP